MSDMESAQASAILLLVFIFIITWEKLLLTSMDDTRQVSLLVGTYINLVLYGIFLCQVYLYHTMFKS